jgi:hypothetical protein
LAATAAAGDVAIVVMVHAVFAAMAAVAAVNMMAALAVPLFFTLAVNVVVPQPVFVGAAGLFVSASLRFHEGSVTTIVSLTARAAASLKEMATVVLEAGVGVATTIDVAEKAEIWSPAQAHPSGRA